MTKHFDFGMSLKRSVAKIDSISGEIELFIEFIRIYNEPFQVEKRLEVKFLSWNRRYYVRLKSLSFIFWPSISMSKLYLSLRFDSLILFFFLLWLLLSVARASMSAGLRANFLKEIRTFLGDSPLFGDLHSSHVYLHCGISSIPVLFYLDGALWIYGFNLRRLVYYF